MEKIKAKSISTKFNLNFNEDLNESYKLLDSLYKESIREYNKEIEKLIKGFEISGEDNLLMT